MINGCQRVYLKSYLDDFMWRRMVTSSRYDAYEKILDEIAKYYPANGELSFKYDYEEELKVDFEDDEQDGTWTEETENVELVQDVDDVISVVDGEVVHDVDDVISVFESLDNVGKKKDYFFENLIKNKKRFEFKILSKEQRKIIHVKSEEQKDIIGNRKSFL
ncbi:unnamed protein product [Brachionus calyciflorus]|uniref:Uncharacterized protein n=1 Tax=Brachionus calyciflorus TaxID=104777 RepID=A0A814NVR6_9BILA|nr:unnamed protein product [Brachionus calyciflorus]